MSEDLRKRVEELARLSKDLESNVKMLAHAPNVIAAEQLKKRVKELGDAQKVQMVELVGLHSDAEKRKRYQHLAQQVEELENQIKACKDKEELGRLEKEINQTVEEYVQCFQGIVAELMGAPSPEESNFT